MLKPQPKNFTARSTHNKSSHQRQKRAQPNNPKKSPTHQQKQFQPQKNHTQTTPPPKIETNLQKLNNNMQLTPITSAYSH